MPRLVLSLSGAGSTATDTAVWEEVRKSARVHVLQMKESAADSRESGAGVIGTVLLLAPVAVIATGTLTPGCAVGATLTGSTSSRTGSTNLLLESRGDDL